MTLGGMMKLMVGVVGARFIGAFLNLASRIIFTRLFSTNDVGLILLGMSITSLVSLVASFGYPTLAFTKLPQLAARNQTPTMRAFHGAFLKTTVFMWLLICLACIFATYFIGLPDHVAMALFFACLAALPSSMIRYNSSIANSLRRFGLSYLPDFIYRPLLLLAYVGLAKLLGVSLSVNHVLWAFVAMILIIAVSQAAFLGEHAVKPSHWFDAKPRMTKALRKPAVALLIVAAVATTYTDLVTMVGGLVLPPADVALLAVTIRLASIAAFVIQATQQFILPDMTEALTARDQNTADAMMLKMNYLSLATMVLGILGTLVLGKFVLGIYGAEYVQGYWLLVLFMVGQAIRAIGGMNQYLLSLAGKQLQTATACLNAVVILVAATMLLSPSMGLMGMGVAVVLAELVWAIHLAILAKRLTGRRGDLLWLANQ